MSNKIKGINSASDNNFNLIFPVLPNDINIDRTLTLNVYETLIPEISFTEDIENWQGWDFKHISGNMDFSTWTFGFDIDEDFHNWKKIFQWMIIINNNKDVAGADIEDYMVDASMYIKDNYDNTIMKLKYVNVFPLSLGSVTLNHRQGESYLSSMVTLSYTYFDLEN